MVPTAASVARHLRSLELGVPRLVRFVPTVLGVLVGLFPVAVACAQEGGAPPPPSAQPPATQNPQDPAAEGEATAAADPNKPARRGVPVEDPLVHTHCARCHALDDKQLMTRISFLRKSPEGWSETIKRMGRLYGLQLSTTDAKLLVRSLANSHGLTRAEAERGLYESERRVHWSEENQDQDFRRACQQCHTLGRVLLQQRDSEEWQLLRATHVAMFPLARGQMGGGPPDDERRPGAGGPGGNAPGGAAPGGAAPGGAGNPAQTQGQAQGAGNRGRGNNPTEGGGGTNPTQGVGDRVLAKLAADQPLFTPSWETWAKNKREVPLEGTWTVSGHEIGRGDLIGTADVVRTDADEFDVTWKLAFSDGSAETRTGKGVLYAGYSWRGRSQTGAGARSWREVLLLDDAWQSLRGRLFTGDYDEIGVEVKLQRNVGRPRVLALGNAAIEVPKKGHRLDVYGEAFGANLTAADFFVGEGLTAVALERVDDRHVVLVVDTAAGTELGPRTVALRSDPAGADVALYDTVDYVRIRPLQGLARIGGTKHPKQIERFEAVAMHRGKDEKPYTADDVDLFQVRPRWGLAEFKVRDDDDDLQYVGTIDPATGVFTPNVDGPNPQRKWQANNVGDVFVTAEVELDVGVRPPPPKKDDKKAEPGKDGKQDEKPGDKADDKAKPAPKPAKPEPPPGPLPRTKKTFTARGHLIVTVPLYARWNSLEWEDR